MRESETEVWIVGQPEPEWVKEMKPKGLAFDGTLYNVEVFAMGMSRVSYPILKRLPDNDA